MPEYRRARIEGATYFFTVVTHRRRPVLCLPESLDAMKDVVRKVAETRPFQIDAWVVLPDHLHCVWTMPEGDCNYSERHREGTLWQRRFWEHQIRDEQDYCAHVEYIHFNPVKHGLATRPGDWHSSSFKRWVARGLYEEDWGGDGAIVFPEGVAGE
jgi:putative transposase